MFKKYKHWFELELATFLGIIFLSALLGFYLLSPMSCQETVELDAIREAQDTQAGSKITELTEDTEGLQWIQCSQ